MVGADRHHIAHRALADAAAQLAAAIHFHRRGSPPQRGKRAETTLERWQQVHDLLGKGTGLLECARRLDLSLNTVKRYARAEQPERLRRAPQYRPTLADPYRDYLRTRRAEDSAVPVSGCCGISASSATRQLEPARPVHHPGTRRGRPALPVTRPRGLSRRAVPRDTDRHTGRARLGYDRARVLLKKHTATASGRGLDLHQLRHFAATYLPPRPEVPLQLIMAKTRHRSPRIVMRYVSQATQPLAEVTSLLGPPRWTHSPQSNAARRASSGPLRGCPDCFRMCTEAARLPWRVDASLLGEGHPVDDCSPCQVIA